MNNLRYWKFLIINNKYLFEDKVVYFEIESSFKYK